MLSKCFSSRILIGVWVWKEVNSAIEDQVLTGFK